MFLRGQKIINPLGHKTSLGPNCQRPKDGFVSCVGIRGGNPPCLMPIRVNEQKYLLCHSISKFHSDIWWQRSRQLSQSAVIFKTSRTGTFEHVTLEQSLLSGVEVVIEMVYTIAVCNLIPGTDVPFSHINYLKRVSNRFEYQRNKKKKDF